MLKFAKKISHYIVNQPCLNNFNQCKNPKQIQQKDLNLELIDLKGSIQQKLRWVEIGIKR